MPTKSASNCKIAAKQNRIFTHYSGKTFNENIVHNVSMIV